MPYTSDYAHSGIAPETTLAVGVTTASDTTVTVASGTGWASPTGGQLSFGAFAPDTATESKFTYTGRAGAVLSGVLFSQDGSTAAATYPIGTTVRHIFSAQEAGEANDAVRLTIGKATAANQILVSDGANSFAALAVAASRILARKATGDLVAATAAEVFAILGSGSPGATTFLRGDGSWQVPATGSVQEITLAAQVFQPVTGSPVMGSVGAGVAGAMLFDAAAAEEAQAWTVVPTGWATVDVELWWTNAGAGSGDVIWALYGTSRGDTESVSTVASMGNGTITAPSQNIAKKSAIASGFAVTAGKLFSVIVRRDAASGGDTLANDSGVLAVVLRKAS